MSRREARERDGGRYGMAMDAQMGRRLGKGPVEHDVVWAQELALRHDFEADAEDVAAVDSVRVWIVNLEGGYRRGYSVGALLDVGLLLGRVRLELVGVLGRRGGCGVCGLDNALDRCRREDCRAFYLQSFTHCGDWMRLRWHLVMAVGVGRREWAYLVA